MKPIFSILIVLTLGVLFCPAQSKMVDRIKIAHIKADFSIKELNNNSWKQASEVTIDKYWSGENAPSGRQFRAKLLWSNAALYVRFEANQDEPLIVSDAPNLQSKTKGLWDRDVCEIFLAPRKEDFRHYFEFEIAPTGEWIDLGIYQMPDKRETDWDYHSGMQSAAKIEKDRTISAIKIEWKAFGKTTPKTGDVWLGNILRCVGKDATRGYLTWQPTFTKEASFHVPERFGEFEFVK
ncbi:MAG: carbohydrate-binding family 9-like protein [Acidobacteriota bacterium]|nr:carbohydrate-binding family 9-like protein [Acidobacteriota bacterium]